MRRPAMHICSTVPRCPEVFIRVLPPKIRDLRGLWRRSLIAWPNGERDDTTQVHWLQGNEVYIDLRQPDTLPNFASRRGLAELSFEDCLALAQQEGFAGRFTFDGEYFEWARQIDFQPKALHSDAGSLRWEGAVLVERGRDIDYIEHWHRDATALTPAAAVSLREIDGRARAALLRVGTVFMWARDRTVVAPMHKTLTECVTEAASLSAAHALIDCEISFGSVDSAGLLVTASSLPYRVGDRLEPKHWAGRLTTQDRAAAGTVVTRHWEITDMEGELGEIAVQTAASTV
jgi:hypothetical protein